MKIPEKSVLKRYVSRGSPLWQIVMLFFCTYVLVALFIQTAFKLSDEMNELLYDIDSIVCLVFLADFSFKFFAARDKLRYLRWGWIDFVSAIPFFHFLRWGRFVMIINIIRFFRAVKSVKIIVEYILQNRAKGVMTAVVLVAFVVVVFSSITVLAFEKDIPEANIKTPDDALWWAVVTVTTVGYGDRFPVTTFGRIVGAILMISGISLFGTFTAYVARYFFQPEFEAEEMIEHKILREIREIRHELDDIKKQIEQKELK